MTPAAWPGAILSPSSTSTHIQVETVMPRKGQRPMLDPTCTYLGRWIRLGYIHTCMHSTTTLHNPYAMPTRKTHRLGLRSVPDLPPQCRHLRALHRKAGQWVLRYVLLALEGRVVSVLAYSTSTSTDWTRTYTATGMHDLHNFRSYVQLAPPTI